MLCLCLYQVFVLVFPWMISWNSVASSQKLWKRQAVNLCPNNKWKEHNEICYLAVRHDLKHSESTYVCKNKFVGSYLAKIRSSDDLKFIVDTFEFKKNYWIGLKQKTWTHWKGQLAWQDGSNGNFVNFAPGEPTNYAGENCIVLDGVGRYWDETCDRKYWSLCSVSASVDFCKTKNFRCHENAQCYSTFLSFVCLCNDGFVGDGISSCKPSEGCPNSEWKEHKGHCFIAISKRLTYFAARHNCRSKYNGSSLAKFRYEGDRIFFQNSFNFSGHRWLGLRRTTSWRDELKWDDKSNVTYKSFAVSQPEDFRYSQYCIITNNEGQWDDNVCDIPFGSFCSIDASQSGDDKKTTTVKTKFNVCPFKKWILHNEMCFLGLQIKAPHPTARIRCKNKHFFSHLVKIRSRDDLRFLVDTFEIKTPYWIGLRQKREDRRIVKLTWEDGSNATFTNFFPGEPNKFGYELCTAMWKGGSYFDADCHENYWSICSVPASVDFCKENNIRCHENAQCYSTFSTFLCLCNDGFAGDGISSCNKSDGCPNDQWKEHKGHCFIAISKNLTYLAARHNCKMNYAGSSLAKIRFEGDRIFLQNSFNFSGHRWLGLRRTTSWRDELKWDDKSNVTYTSFALSQPDDFGYREYCIVTNNEGQWDDNVCDIPFGSFCSIDAWQSGDHKRTTTVETKFTVCPNKKWILHNEMCFLGVQLKAPHPTARIRCRNKHFFSHLLKIRSRDDLRFLVDTFEFKTPYWIGLKQKKGDGWKGKITWEDGSNATFINFFPGEPNKFGYEHCIAIWKGGSYFDAGCEKKYWSICSVPASVDLCKDRNIRCHENAQCYSTFYTFLCLCNDGFFGDGISSCKISEGCPNDQWKEHKGLCFIANPKRLTYLAARRTCKSKYNGSSLAKFRYEGDRSFLQNSFKFSGHRWLGLRRTTSWRDELKWDDKSIVTYKSFALSQPDAFGYWEYCIVTNNEGQWDDYTCDITFGSFCSIDASQSGDDKSTTTVKTKFTVCPNKKWILHNEMCFLEIQLKTPHSRAWLYCKNKYFISHLVKIRSRDDLKFLVDTFDFKNPYWIGLKQKKGDRWKGKFTWEDGSNANFINFFPVQPNNFGSEQCIAMWKGGAYFAVECDEDYWSICSVPARLDLCKDRNIRCHENAQCYSTFYTFLCLCNDGFVGDGISSCNKSDGCPNDQWKEHKGLCYIHFAEELTYDEARHNCRSKYKGSSLAKFRYEGDQSFVVNTFKFSEYRWVGLRFRTSVRVWDDNTWITYISFALTEPNVLDGKEECFIADADGNLHDDQCGRYHGSFCSIKALDSGIAVTTKPAKTTTAKTTTVTTTTIKVTTIKTTTVGTTTTVGITTTVVGTTTADKSAASAFSEGTGPLFGVVGCLLVVGVLFGYKKYRSQRNNAQKRALYSKDVDYEQFKENASEE